MTAPISVDPSALAATGTAVGAEGDEITAAVGALESGLSGAGAMFGHDAAAVVFAQGYAASGKSVLDAAASGVNACRRVGLGIRTSAANYDHANASSTVGGGRAPLPTPDAPARFDAPSVPPPFGDGIAAPIGWALVEGFVGDVWPDGNPAELRAAATVWRSFGTTMSGLAGQVRAKGTGLSAEQIPEAHHMGDAVGGISSGLDGLALQANQVASNVDGFASAVETTQNAVRSLLDQLSLSGVMDTIGGIFTGHNPIDEVREVAHEIKVVLDNMKREADATSKIFTQGINMLDSATDSLEKWAKKEFTDALGQDVGGAVSFGFTALVDQPEGALKFVAETVQGVQGLDPTRFAYDPSGAAKTWEGLLKSTAVVTNPVLLAKTVLSDPQGSLDTVKDLVDWKDVEAGHPFRAVGYDTAQVASALIPGVGEAEPAIEGASVAGRAASVEERTAAGAAREGIPGLAAGASASDDVATQAARVGKDLDGITVPESATAGAAPGASAPTERPPVDVPAPPAEAPSGRAPVDTAPPADGPGGHAPVESAPRDQGPHAPSPNVAEPHATEPVSPMSADPPSPHSVEPAPPHADASRVSEPAQIAESNPSPPPSGGGSHGSAPAASEPSAPMADTSPFGAGDFGSDASAAAGADDKVPVSAGAHGDGLGDGAGGSGHGSGGGSDHGPGGSEHGSGGTGQSSPDSSRGGERDLHADSGDGSDGPLGGHHPDFELPPLDAEGFYPPGSLPSFEDLRALTSTDPDSAYYWSGRDAHGVGVGPDDSRIAERIAAGNRGTTLEMTLSENGMDELPIWNRHDPESVRFWEDASAAYADNARGEVTAIVGSDLRPGNIWQTIEIGRLMENPNVLRIVQIDPDTGQMTVIFERGS